MTFKKGASGNPAGRKPGTNMGGKLRQAMADHAPEIVFAVCKRALAGDARAARLVLERVVPALRLTDLPVHVTTPEGADAGTQARAVVEAALSGALAPDTANTLLAAMASAVRVIEVVEFEARIAALEAAQAGKDPE